MIDSNMWSL